MAGECVNAATLSTQLSLSVKGTDETKALAGIGKVFGGYGFQPGELLKAAA